MDETVSNFKQLTKERQWVQPDLNTPLLSNELITQTAYLELSSRPVHLDQGKRRNHE
jgi:hypothetical protein